LRARACAEACSRCLVTENWSNRRSRTSERGMSMGVLRYGAVGASVPFSSVRFSLLVIARESGRSSNHRNLDSSTASVSAMAQGLLDAPLSRGMTQQFPALRHDENIFAPLHHFVFAQLELAVADAFAGRKLVFVAVPRTHEMHLVAERLAVIGAVGS